MFFRIDIALEIVGASPRGPAAGQTHIFLAVAEHSGPLGPGGRKVIVRLAPMSNRIYKGLLYC